MGRRFVGMTEERHGLHSAWPWSHFFLNGILQLDRLAMKCGDIGEVKEEQMAGSLPPRYSFNGRSCRLQEYRRS